MPGGFAGVDVFFVISGFLMTRIIFKGIEQENFSILRFYVARANRIIPALAVLCLVLLVFGWFLPLDYKALAKHVVSSIGFFSNVIYWRESGYFDVASHEKWLLHTWSLSVEWQFYIIYPLVLVAMRKFMSVKAMKATVLLGTVLGFTFCVIATYKWPNPAYYLLPTRAWEMMIGGVAYLYPFALQEKRKKPVEWFGLALIFGSYFLISKEDPWPGYLAIFPVLGSFLIIQAQRNNSLITSNVIFQKLGAWSYSIYLWHWPLVVAIYYFSLNDMFIYPGIALSVLLGFLSNKYIEKIKFRNDFGNLFSYLKCKPVYFLLITAVMGSSTSLLKGIEQRISPLNVPNINVNEVYKYMFSESEIELREDVCRLWETDNIPHGTGCKKLELHDYSNVKAIILGDSHAGSIAPAVLKSLNKYNEYGKIINARATGCIPLLEIQHRTGSMFSGCALYNSYLYEKLNSDVIPDEIPLIIISRLNLYPFGFLEVGEVNKPFIWLDGETQLNENYKKAFKNRFIKNICSLSEYREVYLMRPVPEFDFDVNTALSRAQSMGDSILSNRFYLNINDYNLRNQFISNVIEDTKEKCSINVLNPLEYLLSDKGYISVKGGVSIYTDSSHLNYNGALLISPLFDKIWR
jgi:peptidoglycan/LPS O-acetylase OafA/YrhL